VSHVGATKNGVLDGGSGSLTGNGTFEGRVPASLSARTSTFVYNTFAVTQSVVQFIGDSCNVLEC